METTIETEKIEIPQNILREKLEAPLNQAILPPVETIRTVPEMPPKYVLSEQGINVKGILLEHCYARPYNWRPEANFLRPTKTLFMPQKSKKKLPQKENDEIIDVESVPSEVPIIYDTAKAKRLMDECERQATLARDEKCIDEWEDRIIRSTWTSNQNQLFTSMVNILNSDRMARLAYAGIHNEPVLRRTVVEKSVKRFRQIMAKYSWDTKLAQWLHQLLIDNLSTPYLAAYLDILQTLKHKLPLFVDKIIFATTTHNRPGALSNENLFLMLKRPWDPVATSLNQDKPKKLPGNPVIIIVPSAPSTTPTMYSKRLHRWINLFSNLATVCTVYNNIGSNGHKLTMMNCVDQMFAATRAKIQEIKAEYPNRPIVLAGFNAGAALALQVAQVDSVLCILCLGFSIHTAEGNRGEPDDNLLELQYPVLFVIGQHSNTAFQEQMEDIRERMRVETGLLIVGGADDYLRINKKKKRAEGITQSVVDRCVVDEVGEFLSGLLLSPYPPQLRQSPAHMTTDLMKRPKIERKRNNSNGSSLDSEPPSPTPRISRPGQTLSPPVLGRPPGTKSKSKIEAKWHAMQQGIPPPIPVTPSPTPSTPDIIDITSDTLIDLVKKPPVLKPPTDKPTTKTPLQTKIQQNSAKLQALGIPGRSMYHGSTLSNLLQGGVRTLPPNPTAKQQIKVLENLTIASGSSGKMLSLPGRSIDMSKMTVLNSNSPKINIGNNYGNVMLLPDGKIKTSGPQIRGMGSSSVVFNKGKSSMQSSMTAPTQSAVKTNLTKYITSKKQLLANRNKLVRKMPYISPSTSSSNLPPPTNLTSQDIMDLPIIFADDNQMLTNNTMQPSDTPSSQILQSTTIKSNASGKLLLVNKAGTMIKQNLLKRSAPVSAPTKMNPIKYAKIILSKAPNIEEIKKIKQPPKEVESSPIALDIDLENELVATAITKPNFVPAEASKKEDATKKTEVIEDDSDDPEFVPNIV